MNKFVRELGRVINSLIKVGRDIYRKGYVIGISGNLSGRLDDYIVIKKTGRSLRSLTPQDFVLTRIDYTPPSNVSTDFEIHKKIYKYDNHARYIIHAHPKHLVTISMISDKIEIETFEGRAYFGNQIPIFSGERSSIVDGITYGRKMGVGYVVERGHGVYIFADKIDSLFPALEELEYIAKNRLLRLSKHF